MHVFEPYVVCFVKFINSWEIKKSPFFIITLLEPYTKHNSGYNIFYTACKHTGWQYVLNDVRLWTGSDRD
jgi:hypothetical protein